MRTDWSGDVLVILARDVRSDVPPAFVDADPMFVPRNGGAMHRGRCHAHGAISVDVPGRDGVGLGVRPEEIERWRYQCRSPWFVWVAGAWMPETVRVDDAD